MPPQAPDVGPLKHVTVSCKGGGLGGAWHLAHVTITHPVTQAVTRFDYNNWFDGTQGWVQVSECAAAAPGEYIAPAVHQWKQLAWFRRVVP